MHMYFSGIGGTGIGPLAMVAQQAGYTVSGSDKQGSQYIDYLGKHGISDVHIGQSYEQIAEVHARQPIDWYVYSSAVAIEQGDAPELQFCREHSIKTSKRDEALNQILSDQHLEMLAIAGTHGKTTTTAMLIWLLKQLNIPVSYSVGAKISFGEMGEYTPGSQYFVYEADEFDRNFLAFTPALSLITGIDWDHPDIYPTREDYNQAFKQFLTQSQSAVLWQSDVERLQLTPTNQQLIINVEDPTVDTIKLPGLVNRQNAWQVIKAVQRINDTPLERLIELMSAFPGVSRRFEQIIPGVYSDYAHTTAKIQGALQMGHEVAGDKLVVVYEGLHNTRQHFMQADLTTLFSGLKRLYVVPSYLAREDPNLEVWSPEQLKALMVPEVQQYTVACQLDEELAKTIKQHTAEGDTVLCLTAGGGGSLDEWLRTSLQTS